MFRWLLLLFIIIPAVEIWGLVEVGRWIGGWQTLLRKSNSLKAISVYFAGDYLDSLTRL